MYCIILYCTVLYCMLLALYGIAFAGVSRAFCVGQTAPSLAWRRASSRWTSTRPRLFTVLYCTVSYCIACPGIWKACCGRQTAQSLAMLSKVIDTTKIIYCIVLYCVVWHEACGGHASLGERYGVWAGVGRVHCVVSYHISCPGMWFALI